MIDGVVFWGNETRVAKRIQEMFSFGASEVLVSPLAQERTEPNRYTVLHTSWPS
jgi:hypothetical protein